MGHITVKRNPSDRAQAISNFSPLRVTTGAIGTNARYIPNAELPEVIKLLEAHYPELIFRAVRD